MSTPDLDDTPLIQQALAEENIFLGIKRLSRCLQNTSKRNKIYAKHKESKINPRHHLQVYEKLLQNSHCVANENALNVDQRLVACISELDLQDDKIEELANHIQKLRQNPNAEVILHFLLNLANSQPKESKYTSKKKTQTNFGIFSCPAEMLDGSLFEHRPNYEDFGQEQLASQFPFDLLPGSNLKFAQVFFERYGVPTENRRLPFNKEQDFGYSSPPESEIGFDEVLALGPPSRHRTWECLGHLIPHQERPFLSEAGVLRPSARQEGKENMVTMEQLQRDLTFLLCGITSSCFPFSQEKQKFVFVDGLNVSGLTPQVVEKIFGPMLECGRCHRQLEKFISSTKSENSFIVQALRLAVKKFLVLHREASQRLLERGGAGFSQLLRGMRWLGPPLISVSSLCCPSKPMHGVELLEQLCAQTALLPPGRTACIFYSLLKQATVAYFRILKTWLFEGEIEAESASEFFVQLQPGVLNKRNRSYWTQGFVPLEGRVPGFLKGLEDQLLKCGKAVRLLKLCNPKDPFVCNFMTEQPSMVCCLQQCELVNLQQQCERYEASVRVVCGEPVSACSQMEQSAEQKEAFVAMVQQVHQQRLKEIRAKQQAQRKAAAIEQQRLREDLQRQIEEVKARKADFLRREREEEEEQRQIREAQQAKYDEQLAEEREKVLRHYEDLSKAADVRLKRTQRKIDLLQHELHRVPTESSDDAADINSNTVSTQKSSNTNTDNNANLPLPTPESNVKSPRKIPTTLSLKSPKHFEDMSNANKLEPDPAAVGTTENLNIIQDTNTEEKNAQLATSKAHNLNQSEASRNKAKLLQHELNLITNYNENITDYTGKTSIPENAPSVTEIHNLNITEAARNRAKVLDHELDLITNYNNPDLKKKLPSVQIDIAKQIKNKILREEFGIIEENSTQEKSDTTQKEVVKSHMREQYDLRNKQAAQNKAKALGEWTVTDGSNKDASPTSESLESPCSATSSADLNDKQEPSPVTDIPYSAMTVSMESARSTKTEVETPSSIFPTAFTDIETPSSMCPSAMITSYTSYDTTSGNNLASPGSAMISSSVMTDSKNLTDTPISDMISKLPSSTSTVSFLSALSLLSEPFKWNVTHDKETLSSTVKDLNISTSHLSHLLRQTVSTVLTMQIKLANQSILKLFLQNEQLLEHFYSFRQYFLFMDGEFARNITESLCLGLELHRKKPVSLLNFVSLDSILNHALASSIHGSKDPNALRLSLGQRFEPPEFHLYYPDTLKCVQLQYQVSWPLNLIINPEALNHYDTIFNFLLSLRRGVWAMDKSFQLLQESYTSMDLSRSSQYHKLRLFRHDMACFMQAFHSYIMNFAILQCWNIYEKILKTAKTLDDLYKIHAKFLKQVKFYCLLKKCAEAVQLVLQTVVKCVLKFYNQLSEHSWCKIDGEYTHPAFSQLTQTYTHYKQSTRLFLKHMTKIAIRGHQTALFELLHVLNMNDFYGIKL